MNNLTYICDNKRHLICIPYSISNLHIMAKELNINKCWFHNSNIPHYDIPKLRIEEIMSKCKVVSSKEIVEIAIKDSSYTRIIDSKIDVKIYRK